MRLVIVRISSRTHIMLLSTDMLPLTSELHRLMLHQSLPDGIQVWTRTRVIRPKGRVAIEAEN